MAEKSETFKFGEQFESTVELLKTLVQSVNEGNLLLHLCTIKSILPLFSIFNWTIYLHWVSLYFEDMQNLEKSAPDVYHHFMRANFAVKRTLGKFKLVPIDQCLEQTINRSQLSCREVIGNTKRKEFVAQWELIYPEILDVVNLHRWICKIVSRYAESGTNHEVDDSHNNQTEQRLTRLLKYIIERESPAEVPKEEKLQNILSPAIMNKDTWRSLLNMFEEGTEIYQAFRRKRFMLKSKSISDTISHAKVETFKDAYTGK